jgi:hypothetical protein
MSTTTALKSKVSFAHDGEYQSLDVDHASYLNVGTTPTLVPSKKYIYNADTGEHLDIVGTKYKVTQHKDFFTGVRKSFPHQLGTPVIRSYTSRNGLWHLENYTFREVSGVVHSLLGGKTNYSLQVLAWRSLDGRTANNVTTSLLSSWCMNENLFGVQDGSEHHRAKNTKNYNLAQYLRDISDNAIVFKNVILEQQRLANAVITESARETLIKAIIPQERINTRMIELANANAEYWGNTLASVSNAFTNYATYADTRNGFQLNNTGDNIDNKVERLFDRKFQVRDWMQSQPWRDAVANGYNFSPQELVA